MIKAIIVDDEQHAANRLAELLARHCKQTVQLAGSFSSVEDAIKAYWISPTAIDLLDVQIHDKTGFDLLQQLPEKNFDVIFITAYEKYACRLLNSAQ